MPVLLKLLHKTAEQGVFPNSFYEVHVTLGKSQTKNTTRKGNDGLMSLMDPDAKTLSRILANSTAHPKVSTPGSSGRHGCSGVHTSVSTIRHSDKMKNEN